MDFTTKTLAELSKLFHDGKASSREITEDFIKNIEAKDKDINAFVTTTFDLAREMADAADSRHKEGKSLGPLDGMPIGLKDNVCTDGILTTASSKSLENFIPPYDAEVWARLKAAGCVLLGKLNTDSYTMGCSTETSAWGVTKNPHDLTRVAGGSSGGPAAAVAADMVAGAVGTDTGGSIRQPGHFCGCSGIKVSYGRVSRWGTIPMASSLDTVGAMAKTAEDCAMMLTVMAGRDEKDSTTGHADVPDYVRLIDQDIRGMKIGLPKEYFVEGLSDDTKEAVQSAKAILEDLGATVKEVSLPHTEYGVAAYYIIVPSEVSANMARYDGVRFGARQGEDNYEEIVTETREYGFEDEVKRRIMIGTYALSAGYYDAYYRKAQRVRTLICNDFKNAFEDVDVILAPVAPTPAFKIGQNSDDPVKMYLEDILTVTPSLAGITGINVPVATSDEGLPIGMQVLGPAYSEERILRVAHQMEERMS